MPSDLNTINLCLWLLLLIAGEQQVWGASIPIVSTTIQHHLQTVITDPSIPPSLEQQRLSDAIASSGHKFSRLIAGTDMNSREVRAQRACEGLALLFSFDHFNQTTFLTNGSPTFTDATESNWSETCWQAPACICRPKSVAGVAVALKLFTLMDAQFAVRGAGHNPNPRSGNVNSTGVLLDMSNMKGIKLSPDRRSVKVSAGHHWIDVYKLLSVQGVGAVGTKEPGPGVVGSTLGGGDPFFPSLFGMSVDQVDAFEVVLANSSVIHVNQTSNGDFYRALKGGGPNFGIVTSITTKTVPLNETWWTFREYNATDHQPLLQAFKQYQDLAEFDSLANVVFTLTPSIVLVGFLYAGHTAVIPPVFSPFDGVNLAHRYKTVATPSNGTLAEISTAVGSLDSPGSANRAIFALSTRASYDIYQTIANTYFDYVARMPMNASLAVSYQPVGSNLTTPHGVAVTNVLGVQPIQQQWLAAVAQWTDSSQSDRVISLLREFQTSLVEAVNGVEGDGQPGTLDFVFQNDAGWFQRPLATIGAENIQLLQRVASTYDDTGVFQRLQAGGFLLRDM